MLPLLFWLLEVAGVVFWEVDGTSGLGLLALPEALPWTETSFTFDVILLGSCNGISVK